MDGTMKLGNEDVEVTQDEFEEVLQRWMMAREGTASRGQRYHYLTRAGKRTVIDLASLGSLSFSGPD